MALRVLSQAEAQTDASHQLSAGDFKGKGAESPRRLERRRVTPFPPEVAVGVSTCRSSPLPTRPCSGGGGSAAAMEPAGLEQILKELLLPDTERIRRVRAARPGSGWGMGMGRLWERPGLDPPASHQATEQLQTILRDPAALPALCDLLATATDSQASYLLLHAKILKFLSVPLWSRPSPRPLRS